jgi:histidinol-phosphate/aromatic aminotransferase/cobyric acid decarboxylase-like protein
MRSNSLELLMRAERAFPEVQRYIGKNVNFLLIEMNDVTEKEVVRKKLKQEKIE